MFYLVAIVTFYHYKTALSLSAPSVNLLPTVKKCTPGAERVNYLDLDFLLSASFSFSLLILDQWEPKPEDPSLFTAPSLINKIFCNNYFISISPYN